MNELKLAATNALDEFNPPNDRNMVDDAQLNLFRKIFTEKMESLAKDDSDGSGTSGRSNNLYSYLYHQGKLKGISPKIGEAPSDVLLKKLCTKVLANLTDLLTAPKPNANAPAMIPDDGPAKTEAEIKEEISNKIVAAIQHEFTSVGAVQSISKHYASTQKKFLTRKEFIYYIIENFILGGRTLSTDIPDNLVMTPVGRLSKLLYYISPAKTAIQATTGAAFNAINYIFFGAMIFYLLQLPLLYVFRRLTKGKEKAKISTDEFLFYLAGCAIFGLVGAATFVALFWPFVIAVFSIALVAHTANFILTCVGRGEARKNYEASLESIDKLRKQIFAFRQDRQAFYSKLDAARAKLKLLNKEQDIENYINLSVKIDRYKADIRKLNRNIATTITALDQKIVAHNDIRKAHEVAFNDSKLKFAVAAVILAALVLTFFILSTPVCPPMFIPALVVLAVLGVIGAVFVIAKTANKYKNEEKSKREHAIEVDIAEDLSVMNELKSKQDLKDSAKADLSARTLADDTEQMTVTREDEDDAEQRQALLEADGQAAKSEAQSASTTNKRNITSLKVPDLRYSKSYPDFSSSDTAVSLSNNSVGLFSGKSREGYIEKNYNTNNHRVRFYGSKRAGVTTKLDDAIARNRPLPRQQVN